MVRTVYIDNRRLCFSYVSEKMSSTHTTLDITKACRLLRSGKAVNLRISAYTIGALLALCLKYQIADAIGF